MNRFTNIHTLFEMDDYISRELKGKRFWGEINLSEEELDVLVEHISDRIQKGHPLKQIFDRYPLSSVSYAVFLTKYKYSGNFWNMIADTVGGIEISSADQALIGKQITNTFSKYHFDCSAIGDSRRIYLDSILYEIGEPPESNLGDLFYIFKYAGMGNVDPNIMIDELTSTKSYTVHKPLLHFLQNASDKAVDFIFDIQDTYLSATQNGECSGQYSRAYLEWHDDEKCTRKYQEKKNSEHVEVYPYFYFDNGIRGLCIVLPQRNIAEEWVEEATWEIYGNTEFSRKCERSVQGGDGKRFVGQLVVPVKPCEVYHIKFYYYDGTEMHSFDNQLEGVPTEGVLFFNSNGRKISLKSLQFPYGTIIYPKELDIRIDNVDMDEQYYPLSSESYKIERIVPSGINASIEVIKGNNVVERIRTLPEVHISLHGERFLHSSNLISDIPLFIKLPVLSIQLDGYSSLAGMELRIDGNRYKVDDYEIDLSALEGVNEYYGIRNVRLYQADHFIKQVQFCLLPDFRTNYTDDLCWPCYSGHNNTNIVINKVDEWSLDFTNGNTSDYLNRYDISVPYSEGALRGMVSSNQDKLHVNIEFELPICAYNYSLVSDDEIIDKCNIKEFVEKRIWLNLAFYGQYAFDSYSIQLISVNGIEQKSDIKLRNNGTVNFELSIFSDTIRKIPLPVKLVVHDESSDKEFSILCIDEAVNFANRPAYSNKQNAIAIWDKDVSNKNYVIEKYGDRLYRKILDINSPFKIVNGWRLYNQTADNRFAPGLYQLVNENSIDGLFGSNSKVDVSLEKNQFYVCSAQINDEELTLKIWLERFICDLLKYRRKMVDFQQSNSVVMIDRLQRTNDEIIDIDDIENLIIIAGALHSSITGEHKKIIEQVMRRFSESILTGIDRYNIIKHLVDTDVDYETFEECVKNYSLFLLSIDKTVISDEVAKVANKVRIHNPKLSLLMLMNTNCSFRETIGIMSYQSIIGEDALVDLMDSPLSKELQNDDRKHFLREDGLSSVRIVLKPELSGIDSTSEVLVMDRRTEYLDKTKIPREGILFDGIRYFDQYVNWYIQNNTNNGMDRTLESIIKTDFEEYRKKVGYKEYELESNKQIGSVIINYNNALKRRTTNDEMRFSLPNYFYFVGLASIIIQMPCSGEICEKIAESERFLVHAFRIAPHMVERDVLLASLYMYLKRKEVH